MQKNSAFKKIQQEARKYSFDYSKGTDLKIQFDFSKKHSMGEG